MRQDEPVRPRANRPKTTRRAPSTRRTRPAEPRPSGGSRKLLLYGVLPGVGGALLLAVILIVALSGSDEPPPQPVVTTSRPVRPRPAPKPAKPETLADRINALAKKEKTYGRSYRDVHRKWSELLEEAKGTPLESTVRDRIDRVEGAANKEYLEKFRPVQKQVRDLLGDNKPREARALLERWSVPEYLDLDGSFEKKRKQQLADISEFIEFRKVRAAVEADLRAGRFDTDPKEALAKFLNSKQMSVRAPAETALAPLRLLWTLGRMREQMKGQRTSAVARVDTVRKAIAEDERREASRRLKWARRLKQQTQKKGIPLRRLGADLDGNVHVGAYDGRKVTFAGGGIELTLGVDDVPRDLYSEILRTAPDPADANDLLRAGKLAVRHRSYDAAAALFEQAVKVDASVERIVPSLERIRRGIGTLRGAATVEGDRIGLRYDFDRAGEAEDFRTSSLTKKDVTQGSLRFTGMRLFHSVVGNLKFTEELRISCKPSGLTGNAGYILGAAHEVVPGQTDLFLALLIPGKGFQAVRLSQNGTIQSIGKGPCPATLGTVEMRFGTDRVQLLGAGRTLWAGDSVPTGLLQPVIGGNVSGAKKPCSASFDWIELHGLGSPESIQRLHSERMTVIESELSKEFRITEEERKSRGFSKARSFGKGIAKPLAVEEKLDAIIPAKVRAHYKAVRETLEKLTKVRKAKEYEALASTATRLYDAAVSEADWLPLSYYYRSEWKYLRGNVAGAMEDLGKAIDLHENFVDARVARGSLLLQMSRQEEARRDLDTAIEAIPDLARARLERALLFYNAGDNSAAISEIEIARRLEPGDLYLSRSAKRMRNLASGPRWTDPIKIESSHYTLWSEAPRGPAVKGRKKAGPSPEAIERARRFSDHLEGARRWFTELIPGKGKRARKPIVYLFDTPESYYVYADLTQEDRLEHTAGVYFPRYQQLLFYRMSKEEDTKRTMVHEGFHEYFGALVPRPPAWLNEGMAEYVAGIRLADGKVVERGLTLQGRLRVLQSALERGWKGVPFPMILNESKAQFYAFVPHLQYAQAWSMVHFLFHHEGGRYESVLRDYLKSLLDGQSPSKAYEETFAKQNLNRMHGEWLKYVRALR